MNQHYNKITAVKPSKTTRCVASVLCLALLHSSVAPSLWAWPEESSSAAPLDASSRNPGQSGASELLQLPMPDVLGDRLGLFREFPMGGHEITVSGTLPLPFADQWERIPGPGLGVGATHPLARLRRMPAHQLVRMRPAAPAQGNGDERALVELGELLRMAAGPGAPSQAPEAALRQYVDGEGGDESAPPLEDAQAPVSVGASQGVSLSGILDSVSAAYDAAVEREVKPHAYWLGRIEIRSGEQDFVFVPSAGERADLRPRVVRRNAQDKLQALTLEKGAVDRHGAARPAFRGMHREMGGVRLDIRDVPRDLIVRALERHPEIQAAPAQITLSFERPFQVGIEFEWDAPAAQTISITYDLRTQRFEEDSTQAPIRPEEPGTGRLAGGQLSLPFRVEAPREGPVDVEHLFVPGRNLAPEGPAAAEAPETAVWPASEVPPLSKAVRSRRESEMIRNLIWMVVSGNFLQFAYESIGTVGNLLLRTMGMGAVATVNAIGVTMGLLSKPLFAATGRIIGIKNTHFGAQALGAVNGAFLVAFVAGAHAPIISAVLPLAVLVAWMHQNVGMVGALALFISINRFLITGMTVTEASLEENIVGQDEVHLGNFNARKQLVMELPGMTGPGISQGVYTAAGPAAGFSINVVMTFLAAAAVLFGVKASDEASRNLADHLRRAIGGFARRLHLQRLPLPRGRIPGLVQRAIARGLSGAMAALSRLLGDGIRTLRGGMRSRFGASRGPGRLGTLAGRTRAAFHVGIDWLSRKAYLDRAIKELSFKKLTDESGLNEAQRAVLHEKQDRHLRRSATVAWLGVGSAAVLGLFIFGVAHPFAVASVMILYGALITTAYIKMNTLYRGRSRDDDESLAVQGAMGLLTAVSGFTAIKASGYLLSGLKGAALSKALLWLGAANLPVIALLFWIQRRLRRIYDAPEPLKTWGDSLARLKTNSEAGSLSAFLDAHALAQGLKRIDYKLLHARAVLAPGEGGGEGSAKPNWKLEYRYGNPHGEGPEKSLDVMLDSEGNMIEHAEPERNLDVGGAPWELRGLDLDRTLAAARGGERSSPPSGLHIFYRGKALWVAYEDAQGRAVEIRAKGYNGFRLLFNDELRRYGALAFLPLLILNYLLYTIYAPGYEGGSYLAMITMSFSLGGFIGGLILERESSLIAQTLENVRRRPTEATPATP